MRKLIYLLLVLPFAIFVSCDADFDPNDDWSEKMMVYCLLDQDDDTTYVRIEKCFLGKGNAYEFAKTKGSVYYSPDELDVKMYSYWTWAPSTVVDSFTFQYTTTAKNNGDFYFDDNCPVYYCVTKGMLSLNCLYKLVITNRNTGNQVSASAYLLSDYSIETNTFMFSENKGSQNIVWTNRRNYQSSNSNNMVKQFQVNIRFNYTQNGKIAHIDIPITTRTNNNLSYEHSVQTDTTTILSSIRVKLASQSGLGWYGAAPFEIRISACDLSMFDYLSINNASHSSLNYVPVYSNINGGFGLFAARRHNISRSFASREINNELASKIGAFFNSIN